MDILISGGTGFVGGHLSREFSRNGWSVVQLGRNESADDALLREKVSRADIVVNLAGAPIIARWTEEYKKLLYSSRLDTTRRLVKAISEVAKRPFLFISTSAVGIYASQGIHTEDDAVYSEDFLGRLASSWEKEALSAVNHGIRTVVFRFGIVLGRGGGALNTMLPVFRLGLGGPIGNGQQAFSWVHIDDLVSAYMFIIGHPATEGVFNLTAPNPVTNMEFTRALANALQRPAFLRVPSFALKLRFGQGAQALTEGQRVLPKRLIEAGFKFRFPAVQDALKDLVCQAC